MSLVTGVRAEFFDMTGHKPALKPVYLPFLVARLVPVRFHGNSAVVLQALRQIAAQPKSEKGLERSPDPFDNCDFELFLNDDVANLPGTTILTVGDFVGPANVAYCHQRTYGVTFRTSRLS